MAFDVVKRALRTLPSGLTQLIIHPAKDTPELRATTDNWQHRVTEFEVFSSPVLKAQIKKWGIHIVGYREIRDALWPADSA